MPDRALPHVFVIDLATPVLSADDQHHLERVLRVAPGAEVTVGDGAGRWRRCRFGQTLEPTSEIQVDPAPAPVLAVGFTPVKGTRPEWVVAKLTELGIDRIIPLVSERSIVRWDQGKAERNLVRFRKVAREAAMQSRRSHLPEVAPLTAVAELLAAREVALADPDGDPPSLAQPTVAVGPEGGWSGSELARASTTVTLGPTILRSETAALALSTLLVAIRSGIVRD